MSFVLELRARYYIRVAMIAWSAAQLQREILISKLESKADHSRIPNSPSSFSWLRPKVSAIARPRRQGRPLKQTWQQLTTGNHKYVIAFQTLGAPSL